MHAKDTIKELLLRHCSTYDEDRYEKCTSDRRQNPKIQDQFLLEQVRMSFETGLFINGKVCLRLPQYHLQSGYMNSQAYSVRPFLDQYHPYNPQSCRQQHRLRCDSGCLSTRCRRRRQRCKGCLPSVEESPLHQTLRNHGQVRRSPRCQR